MTCKLNLKTIGAGLIGAVAISAYVFKFRPWHLRWGATEAEIARTLPGDDLVPRPKQSSTRAITIEAPRWRVWPWLAQLGQGRGGFYSYDWLENLAGCDIHNADQILPVYQTVKLGDRIRLGPEGYPYYTIAAAEPERALVLRAGDPDQDSPPVTDIWLFYLEELGPDRTRLIARNRRDFKPTLANFIIWQIITEPLHFLMEQKMLRGIKSRAEAAKWQRVPA